MHQSTTTSRNATPLPALVTILLAATVIAIPAHALQVSSRTTPIRTTALIDAVDRGDTRAVRELLAAGADVEEPAADSSTALHRAVHSDDPVIVALLLDAGARVDAASRYSVTPLALAAQNGSEEMLGLLLDAGTDPNETTLTGQTALMTAALNGRPEALRVLIGAGAAVDAREPVYGQTALMWAAGKGNTDAVAVLVDAGADIQAPSGAGFTSLLFAVLYDRIETARVLIERGANVNDVSPDGTSALNMAIVNTYYDMASLLLDHGADPNAADPRGSALHSVAWLRRPGATGSAAVGNDLTGAPIPTSVISALELAEELLEHGADPNLRVDWRERPFDKQGAAVTNPPDIQLGRHILSYNGATPYWLAANNGDVRLMRMLLEGGADPSIPNRFDVTPLMVAAGLNYYEGETPGPFTGTPEAERLEAVKLALESGNPINARADFGDTPILGDPEYTLIYYPTNIDELAELGAGDPRWDGSTALHGAVVSGQPSIVRYLIDQGADIDAVNDSGWTPLMLSRGFFLANAEKVYPEIESVITAALKEQGLWDEDAEVE
jgi:ankyrin repeat protein